MTTKWAKLRAWFQRGIWEDELSDLPVYRGLPMRLLRNFVLATQSFVKHQLPLRSAALVYMTVLSLVPTLAFGFSAAKGFGLYDRLVEEVVVPFLDTNFGPTGGVVVKGGDEGERDNAGDPEAEGSGLDGADAGLPDDAEPEQVASARAAIDDALNESLDGNLEEDLDEPLNAEPGVESESLNVTTGDADSELDGVEDVEQGNVAIFEDGELPSGEAADVEIEQPSSSDGGVRASIDQVLLFVEKTDVTSLGAFGLVVLAAAVIRLLTQVENALNLIWGASRPRRLLRRMVDYLAMVIVAPLLALTATSAKVLSESSSVLEYFESDLRLGGVMDVVFSLGPILTMWGVFTLLYMVMPNTRVRPFSAMLGGFVAAVMWSLIQVIYVKSQVGVSSYHQLYAGFAAIPLFLLWLYLSWMSVLVGAEFGHADQAQQSLRRQALSKSGTQAYFEAAVLSAVGRIARRFEEGGEPIPLADLVDEVEIPEEHMRDSFERLAEAGLLAQAGDEENVSFLLAKASDRIRVSDLLRAMRGSYPSVFVAEEQPFDLNIKASAKALEHDLEQSRANLTLRQLVQSDATESKQAAVLENGNGATARAAEPFA